MGSAALPPPPAGYTVKTDTLPPPPAGYTVKSAPKDDLDRVAETLNKPMDWTDRLNFLKSIAGSLNPLAAIANAPAEIMDWVKHGNQRRTPSGQEEPVTQAIGAMGMALLPAAGEALKTELPGLLREERSAVKGPNIFRGDVGPEGGNLVQRTITGRATPPLWQGPPTPQTATGPLLPKVEPIASELPSGRRAPTAAERAARASEPAGPPPPPSGPSPEMLDGIAKSVAGKPFARMTPEEQASVRSLASRLNEPTQSTPPAPNPNFRVETGPPPPTGKSIGQMLDEELAARRAAAQQPEPPAAPPALPEPPVIPPQAAEPPIVPGKTVAYTGEQPAAMRTPESAAAATALAEELQKPSLAQVEARMAQKAAAPTESPTSQFTAAGELKSPELRAAEITGQNRIAKAQRFADALRESGIDPMGVRKIEKGYASPEQIQQGVTPRWGNIAEHLGEKEPSLDTVGEIIRQMGKRAEPGPVTGGIADKLQETADAALDRVRQRGTFKGTKLNAAVPVDDLADMAIWGAAKIAKGTVNFATWSKEMIADAGAQIKPHLQDLYDQAKNIYQAHVVKTEGKLSNLKELMRLYRAGEEGKDWYKYTQAELEQHLGADAPLFVDMLAVTSPNASVASNVMLALKAYAQYKTGQAFKGFMPAVIQNLEKVVQGESPTGPKVTSFKANLFGNTEAVTVDRWMARAMGWPTDNLTLNQYKFMDYTITQAAKKAGVEPRQMQAAAWKAIKAELGKKGASAETFEQILARNVATKPELGALLQELRNGPRPVPSQ